MERGILLVVSIIIIFFFTDCNQKQNSYIKTDYDFTSLGGPYFEQQLPGNTAKRLAPGFISSDDFELCSGFLDSGKIFVFNRQPKNVLDFSRVPMLISEYKNARWTLPTPAPFYNYYPFNFTTSPDNKTLFFTSKIIPGKGCEMGDGNIWVVKKTMDGWSSPKMLEVNVNTEKNESYPSVTNEGTLYFMSEGRHGDTDIYRSEQINGKYIKVENLGLPINTEYSELDPVIAPDESFLIYTSDKLTKYGKHDLYVAFRKADGSWTNPVNMGETVNSSAAENRANVTADGKYILFMRGIASDANIYWVSASIIDKLKPKYID